MSVVKLSHLMLHGCQSIVEAAQERGRARDLEATVAGLLVELEKRQNQGV